MGLVQQSGTSYANVTTASRTFPSTPVAGHLLIAMCAHQSAGSSPAPSTWTALPDLASGNLRAQWWYKYADGTESVVSLSSITGFGSFWIGEFDDLVSGAPIVAEDETAKSTIGTSVSSGSATATLAGGLALAFFAADDGNNVDGSRAYSNSFSELVFQYSAGLSRASAALASKTITTTGAYSTTFSCTDTGDELYGSIALFQAATVALTVNDATHASSSDVPTLAAASQLAAADALHAHTATTLTLTGHASGGYRRRIIGMMGAFGRMMGR